MTYLLKHRKAIAILLLAALLVGWPARPSPVTGASRSGAATVTLSVYTCCGSLAGFNDRNPADLSSLHALYAGLWARLFPQVRWQETTFGDQAAMEASLATAVRAGASPDMVFVQGGDVGYLVLRHLAQPLDSFYAHAHIPVGSFLPGMARWAHFGGHWWAIPAVSGPLGGQQIYLPKYMSRLGFDNKTLRTFDDYYRMSRLAVRRDGAGNPTRIGYWPGLDSWESIGTLMCAPGHGLYDAADRPTATDPCNAAYLRYLKKLADLYGGYARLARFLAHDPDFLSGNPKAYLATGQALDVPSGEAYWNIAPLDANTFGVKGGLDYQLTPLPPTPRDAPGDVTSYPTTMQEVIVPRDAHHADLAFAVGKMMFWDHGDLLGRSLSGSPVVSNQQQWLGQVVAGEAALRRQAGLSGNPAAHLQGLKMQPALGQESRAANPINPVDPYYQQQLNAATVRVLDGQQSVAGALASVQQNVMAQERRLQSQFGAWSW